MNDELTKAVQKALRLLSYGARSRRGLYEKLKEAGFDDVVCLEAISYAEEQGFVNDEKMAADFAAFAVESKAYGKYRVINELINKGIDRELAESAYSAYVNEREEDGDIDVDLENAVVTLEKRMRQTRVEPDELDEGDIRRLTGYLHRRGFSFGVISRAFAKVKEEAEDD